MIRNITYLAYFFMLSELLLTVTKRAGNKGTVKKSDKGSLSLIWIAIGVCVTAGFFLSYNKTWTSRNYYFASAGMVIYLTGLILRWASILQLKGAFTVNVAVNSDQRLKTDGLYKRIRHPSYLGLMLIITGLAISMNTLISLIVVTVPVYVAIFYRINVEEKLLLEFFGDKYAEYSARTKRVIPFIL